MSESLPNQESPRITDEQIVEALKNKTPEAQDLFERWYKELQEDLDRIYEVEGSEKSVMANMECCIRRAVVYYRAGHRLEAYEDLEETSDAALAPIFQGSGIYEQIVPLLERMKNGETI